MKKRSIEERLYIGLNVIFPSEYFVCLLFLAFVFFQNIFVFFQMPLLSDKCFYFPINVYFFPLDIFTSHQMFLLPYNYIYLPANTSAFLHILFSNKCFYFSSDICVFLFALMQIFCLFFLHLFVFLQILFLSFI